MELVLGAVILIGDVSDIRTGISGKWDSGRINVWRREVIITSLRLKTNNLFFTIWLPSARPCIAGAQHSHICLMSFLFVSYFLLHFYS